MVMSPNNPLFNRSFHAVNDFMAKHIGEIMAVVIESRETIRSCFMVVGKGVTRDRNLIFRFFFRKDPASG